MTRGAGRAVRWVALLAVLGWLAVTFVLGAAFVCREIRAFQGMIAAGAGPAEGAAALFNAVMSVTGTIAILLMAVHLAWAIVVLVRNVESEKHRFHRFSVVVWAIWLVPYLTGAIGAGLS